MIAFSLGQVSLSEAERTRLDSLLEDFEASWCEGSTELITQLTSQLIGSSKLVEAAKLRMVKQDIAMRAQHDLEIDIEWYSQLLNAGQEVQLELYRWHYECLNSFGSRIHKVTEFLATVPNGLVGQVATQLGEFARYKLLRLIGEGGMGKVYLAIDRELNRQIAFKCLSKSKASNATLERAFRREVQIASALQHPSILPVYGAGHSSEGDQGYAMRLLAFSDGKLPDNRNRPTIEALIDELHLSKNLVWRGFQSRELLQRFRNVCDAISYAHQQNITHNDIKPHNIFILNEETFVGDWGVADWVDEPSQDFDLVGYSLQGGTKEYMSPQRLNRGSATKHDDIYSLGACLYHLLNGHSPTAEQPLPWKPIIPAALRSICEWSMNPSVDLRCPSADILSAEVGRWLAGERVQCHRESSNEWLRRSVQNHTSAFMVAAVGMVAMMIASLMFTGVFYWQRSIAQQESARAREAENNERDLRLYSDKLVNRELQIRELFLGSLKAGNPRGKFGPDLTMREALGLSEEKMRSQKNLSWDLKVEMLQTLGNLYMSLNQVAKAWQCLDDAWELVKDNPEATDMERAKILFHRGMARLDEKGVELLQNAQEILERIGPESNPLLLQIIGEISWRKELLGDSGSDDLMFASVVPLLEPGSTVADVKATYYRLLEQIKMEWAAGHRQETSRIIRTAAKPALSVPWLNEAVPSSLRAIAHKREKVNDLISAEALFTEAVALTLDQSGKRKSYYEDLFSLAFFLANHGRPQEAITHLNEIVADLSKQDLAADLTLSYALTLLGRLASERGETEEAIRYFERAYPLLQKEAGATNVNSLYVACELSKQYVQLNQFPRAVKLLEPLAAPGAPLADKIPAEELNRLRAVLDQATKHEP